MAVTPSANFSPTFQVPTAGTDQFDVTMLDVALSALDTHTHAANKGLAVARVTLPASVLTAAGALSYAAGPLLYVGDGTTARAWGSTWWQRIAGDGAMTTFDFTSIPAQFETLEIVVEGRLADVAVNGSVNVRFNNDSGANYYSSNYTIDGAGTIVASAGLGLTSGAALGFLSASTAPAGATGAFRLLVPGYSQTGFNRRYLSSGGYRTSSIATGQFLTYGSGEWANTANAINRVTLTISATALPTTVRATLYLKA